MSTCEVVTFPLVSWVRCGAWLYWFLIFALFLTLKVICNIYPALLGVKVISNAGGVNPLSCAAALKEVCNKANTDLNIAVVTGDDLMPQVSKERGWLY